MMSLMMPIVFFCILVLLYPVASLVLSISTWLFKQRVSRRNVPGDAIDEMIDKKTDELKEVMFNILVFLIFFIISPFVLFYLMRLIN